MAQIQAFYVYNFILELKWHPLCLKNLRILNSNTVIACTGKGKNCKQEAISNNCIGENESNLDTSLLHCALKCAVAVCDYTQSVFQIFFLIPHA